jgi:Flp pilus assembly protein TadG
MTAITNGTRRGAAAVELAFLLPFLAFVFAAAVDFARVFYATQTLTTAAATGATYASGTAWVATGTETTDAAATAAAVREGETLDPPVTAANVTVTRAGGTVTVTVRHDFPLLTAILVPAGTVRLERAVTADVAPRAGY